MDVWNVRGRRACTGLANEGKVVVRGHAFRVVGAVHMDHLNVNLGVPESSAPGMC